VTSFEAYLVVFVKSGEPPLAVAGPFCGSDSADAALEAIREKQSPSHWEHYKLASCRIPVLEFTVWELT
jgi:hypothetical protein